MEGVGACLHLESWWCERTCNWRNGIIAILGSFSLDMGCRYQEQNAQFSMTTLLPNISLIVSRRQITY